MKTLKILSATAIVVLAVSFGTGLYISHLNDKAIAQKSKESVVGIIKNDNIKSEQPDGKLLEEVRKAEEEAKAKAVEEEKKKEEERIKLEEEARIKAEQEANQKEEERIRADQEAKQKEAERIRQQELAKAQSSKSTPSVPENNQVQTKPNTNQASKKSASSIRTEIPLNFAFEYLENIEDQIVVLCNQERAKAGLKPLAINETLRQSSRYKSNEMLQHNYFDHVSPITGYNPWELAKAFGYSYTRFGENIWYGSGYSRDKIIAKLIVDSWMNSPGHKSNIMNKDFGRIGVGIVYSNVNKKVEATQQFSN